MNAACLRYLTLLAMALAWCVPASAAETRPDRAVNFRVLQAPAVDAVRDQAHDWLRSVGKYDETAFNKIWAGTDRPALDLLADTFALGHADARAILAHAADATQPAPVQVPDLLKDAKLPTFFRANLALAYAKALTFRKVYEEALDALAVISAEQVVDPAGYFFHKAVCAHGLMDKAEASRSLAQLTDDVVGAPERYKMVAVLMQLDMAQWKKDLGDIERKMRNVERRLELARAGPETRRQQKEIVNRLDEMIKKLEGRRVIVCDPFPPEPGKPEPPGCPPTGKPVPGTPVPGDPNGPPGPNGPPANNPNGPPGSTNQPSNPMNQSNIANNGGAGNVNERVLRQTVEMWGRLPERERVQAMMQLIRQLPPAYRQMIEDYYRRAAGFEVVGR